VLTGFIVVFIVVFMRIFLLRHVIDIDGVVLHYVSADRTGVAKPLPILKAFVVETVSTKADHGKLLQQIVSIQFSLEPVKIDLTEFIKVTSFRVRDLVGVQQQLEVRERNSFQVITGHDEELQTHGTLCSPVVVETVHHIGVT